MGWFKGDWYVSATNKYTYFPRLNFENIPPHHTEKTQYNNNYVVHCLVLGRTIKRTMFIVREGKPKNDNIIISRNTDIKGGNGISSFSVFHNPKPHQQPHITTLPSIPLHHPHHTTYISFYIYPHNAVFYPYKRFKPLIHTFILYLYKIPYIVF